MSELPRFGIEALRGLPAKELDDMYWGAWNGQPLYDYWHHEDFLLVEELDNACRRHLREPIEHCQRTVSDVLGEEGMDEACAVAKYRSQRQRDKECLEKHGMTEAEMDAAIEAVEIYEDGKLAHALRCWYEEQLTELIRGLWADPHWEKIIQERCGEKLPRLALVPPESVATPQYN